jgi:hypothetical protein
VAAAVTAASRIASEEWMRSTDAGPIGPLVLAALDRFATGLATPPTG